MTLRRVEENERRPAVATPRPPFIEIGIHRTYTPDWETFADALTALTELGANPTGEIYVWDEHHRFASITDEPAQRMTVEPHEVAGLIGERSPFVLQVKLTGYFPDDSLLSYLSVSRKAALIERHPVALWASGADVTYEPATDTVSGPLAREALLSLVRGAKPSYGAITIDYPLECPCDLAENPESEAFSDFFIADDYLDPHQKQLILEVFAEAYCQEVEGGLFVSCTSLFNPSGVTMSDWLTKSPIVAEAIGAHCARV